MQNLINLVYLVNCHRNVFDPRLVILKKDDGFFFQFVI